MTRSLTLTLLFIQLLFGCTRSDSIAENETTATQIQFVDEAFERGLAFTHQSGANGDFLMPEIMGGGVMLVDVDGDDDLDAYLVQSGSVLNPQPSHRNTMYMNDGAGFFSEYNAGDASRHLGYGMGVTVGDYDNDGDVDLYVTNLRANALLENNGEGRFRNVASTSGVDEESWGTASVFMDFDNDGWLDLFVVNYIDWSHGIEFECYHPRLGTPEYCSPLEYRRPAQDRLFKNNGDGTFTDVTLFAGMLGVRGNGLGVVSIDVNDDGLMDIFVSNDSMPNHLWLNQGGFKFVESAFEWGCAVDEHGRSKAGMGVVSEDFDGDSDFDVLVVNLTSQTDTFFSHEGTHFVDSTAVVGLGNTTRRYTRFGLISADFNNDGWLDLFEANGAIIRSPETTAADPYSEPNDFFLGIGEGHFERIELHLPVYTSRGASAGDIDGDGRVDLLIGNKDALPSLLMNRTDSENNWVKIRVKEGEYRDSVGAVISARIGDRRITRRVHTDGSYLSSVDSIVSIGLGSHPQLTEINVKTLYQEEIKVAPISAGETTTIRVGDPIPDVSQTTEKN